MPNIKHPELPKFPRKDDPDFQKKRAAYNREYAKTETCKAYRSTASYINAKRERNQRYRKTHPDIYKKARNKYRQTEKGKEAVKRGRLAAEKRQRLKLQSALSDSVSTLNSMERYWVTHSLRKYQI